MRTVRTPTDLAALGIALIVLCLTLGCDQSHPSSVSIEDSQRRGRFIAEYRPVGTTQLGEYRVLELWVEDGSQGAGPWLVVRLKGPHHGAEPRVEVAGVGRYRTIWSERDGPPYEIWEAPEPLPASLLLEGGGAQGRFVRL